MIVIGLTGATGAGKGVFGKVAGRILSAVFSLVCLFCAIACMRNFIAFVDTRILSLSGGLLPSIIFTTFTCDKSRTSEIF